MTYHSTEEYKAFKIMLLQLRKRRLRFLTRIRGDFAQKRTLRADRLAADLQQYISEEAAKLGWSQVPRARVAVSMHFFPQEYGSPDLHNLVKFYLDLLHPPIFYDDRQVGYLVAQRWRPPKHFDNLNRQESSAYVEVERLSDYIQRFDLSFELLKVNDFRQYLKRKERWLAEDDEFEMPEMTWLDEAMINSLQISSEAKERFRKSGVTERQRHLLGLNKIDRFDRPGRMKGRLGRTDWMKEFPELLALPPFSIDLGDLPARGESKLYRERIRASFRKLKSRLQLFGEILIPVELDVQVTTRKLKPGKDLDNIMLDIVPAFAEELLHEESYLQGFRIYIAGKQTDSSSAGSIGLKLLPPGAISEFEERMNATLKAGEEWLEQKLGKMW